MSDSKKKSMLICCIWQNNMKKFKKKELFVRLLYQNRTKNGKYTVHTYSAGHKCSVYLSNACTLGALVVHTVSTVIDLGRWIQKP